MAHVYSIRLPGLLEGPFARSLYSVSWKGGHTGPARGPSVVAKLSFPGFLYSADSASLFLLLLNKGVFVKASMIVHCVLSHFYQYHSPEHNRVNVFPSALGLWKSSASGRGGGGWTGVRSSSGVLAGRERKVGIPRRESFCLKE